jgi:hypothetical protein
MPKKGMSEMRNMKNTSDEAGFFGAIITRVP